MKLFAEVCGSAHWLGLLKSAASLFGFMLFVLYGAYVCFRTPLLEYGDAREYIIQTQAIFLEGQLAVNTEKLAQYWNSTSPFSLALGRAEVPKPIVPGVLSEEQQARGGFGSLYPDRFGQYRYAHYFMYSFFAVPFYAFFHWLDPSGFLEYLSFRVTNLCFLFLPLFLLWMRAPGLRTFFLLGLLWISPAISYCSWPHSEVFCFGLVLLSFVLLDFQRWRFLSPLVLGLAVAQNIPLILFFPIHLAFFFFEKEDLKRPRFLDLFVYALGGLIAASANLYFYYYFGVFSLIEELGFANFGNISLARLKAMYFSPMIGALWYYPAIFILSPLVVRKDNRSWVAAIACSAFLVSALSCATNNLSSSQIGAVRYALWFLAPFWWVILRKEWQPDWRPIGRCLAFVAACLMIAGVGFYFKTFSLVKGNFAAHETSKRFRSEVAEFFWATRFREDPEVFAERVEDRELMYPHDFNKIYIWNMDNRRSLWLVSKRAANQPGGLSFVAESLPEFSGDTSGLNVELKGGRVYVRFQKMRDFSLHPYYGRFAYIFVSSSVTQLENLGQLPFRVKGPGCIKNKK